KMRAGVMAAGPRQERAGAATDAGGDGLRRDLRGDPWMIDAYSKCIRIVHAQGSGTHRNRLNPSTSASPTTPRIVSTTVQVRNVSPTVSPKHSFTIQNPPSFRWERKIEPNPSDTTSSSRLISGCSASV